MTFDEIIKLFDKEIGVRDNIRLLRKEFLKDTSNSETSNALNYYIRQLEFIKQTFEKNAGRFNVNLKEMECEFKRNHLQVRCMPTGIVSDYNFFGSRVVKHNYALNIIPTSWQSKKFGIELATFYYGGPKENVATNSHKVELNILQTLRKLSKNRDNYSKLLKNICIDLLKYKNNDLNK